MRVCLLFSRSLSETRLNPVPRSITAPCIRRRTSARTHDALYVCARCIIHQTTGICGTVLTEPMYPAFARVGLILQEDQDNLMVRVSAATVTLVIGSNFVKRCHMTALTSLFFQGSTSPSTARCLTVTRKTTASRHASPVAITSVSRDSLFCAVSAPLQRHSWSPYHQSRSQHRRRQQPDGLVTDLLMHHRAACASRVAAMQSSLALTQLLILLPARMRGVLHHCSTHPPLCVTLRQRSCHHARAVPSDHGTRGCWNNANGI